MAENYKVFDDGTWSLFTEGINDLSQKANNAIQGVKQNGTELTPDENGVINIENDYITVVNSTEQPEGLEDGDVWEEILNDVIIEEGNGEQNSSEKVMFVGKEQVIFDSFVNFPEVGEEDKIYVDTDITDALSMYRWNGTEYVIAKAGVAVSIISDEFSEESAYEENSYVIVDDAFYKVTSNKEEGAWDETVVEETNVAKELKELNTLAQENRTTIDELASNFSTAANDIGNAIVAVGGTVPEGATFAEMAQIIINSMVSVSDIVGEAVKFTSPTSYTGGSTALASGSSITCKIDIAKLSITMTVGINCWSTDSWRSASIDGYVYKNGTQVGKAASCTAHGGSEYGGSNTGTGTLVLTDLKAGDVITVNYSYGSNNAEARYPSISGTATVIDV